MELHTDVCLAVDDIYLPAEGVDMSKWAVVACDQYTSEPEYWHEVEREVGDDPEGDIRKAADYIRSLI